LAFSQKIKNQIIEDHKFTCYKISQYSCHKKDPITFLDLQRSYRIQDDIFLSSNTSAKKSDNNEYDYITLEYILHSKKQSCKDIENFLNRCLEQYRSDLLDTMKSQHIFIFKEIDEDNNVVYQEFPFETTKSFDNMFFDQKDELLKRVDNFTNNKSEYVRLGIPYTLGILLHGIPGAGKTSYIKALAKHTGRHLVVLPTRNIKNIETLKTIFLNEDINGVKIPNSKRIYIMEEIDCSEWRSVVLSRALRKDEKQPDDDKSNNQDALVEALVTLNKSDDDDKKKLKPKKNESQTLTLGDFLELLDGIVEIPGRMLVMSSNHPEVLDPALVRPGRIDMVIEFKKLSRKSVRDVYKHWFNKDIPNDVYSHMKDYMFSQADLGNMFARFSQAEIYRILCGKN